MKHAIALLFIMTAQSLPAHDGAHGPQVLGQVVSATVEGTDLHLTLKLTGVGAASELIALSAEWVGVHGITPTPIRFAEDVTVSETLRFKSSPPGIFTLMLDFGLGGMGQLAVMPEF